MKKLHKRNTVNDVTGLKMAVQLKTIQQIGDEGKINIFSMYCKILDIYIFFHGNIVASTEVYTVSLLNCLNCLARFTCYH